MIVGRLPHLARSALSRSVSPADPLARPLARHATTRLTLSAGRWCGLAGQRVCVAVNHLPPAVDAAEDMSDSQVLAAWGPADSCARVLDPYGVADFGSEVS